MAGYNPESLSSKLAEVTGSLAKAPKMPRKKKKTRMTIEPTDNKGFIVNHDMMEEGMPTSNKKHSFSNAGDMHKHVMKVYPAKAPTEAQLAEEEKEGPLEAKADMKNKG